MKVAIVGAGLLGRLTALALIKSDHEVTLFESHSFDRAKNTAAISAAMIAPLSESIHMPLPLVDMGLNSLRLWPEILQEVQRLDPKNVTVGYQSHGTLAVAFPDEQERLLDHYKKLLSVLEPYRSSIRMLYNDEVVQLEPGLSRFETAVYLAQEANIDNQQFLNSTTRVLRKYCNIIDHWPLQGDGLALQEQYNWIVDCRGAGAVGHSTHAQDGRESLVAIRGEVLRIRTTQVKLKHSVRIIRKGFTVYITPKPKNIFVIGATDSDKQGSRSVTVRSSLDLLSALYAVHPGFADAEIVDAVAGQRAQYTNRMPAITQYENILAINGLNRQGWLLAPSLVNQLLDKFL